MAPDCIGSLRDFDLLPLEMDCVPEQKCTHWRLEGTRLWPKQSKTEWHPCSRLSTRVGSFLAAVVTFMSLVCNLLHYNKKVEYDWGQIKLATAFQWKRKAGRVAFMQFHKFWGHDPTKVTLWESRAIAANKKMYEIKLLSRIVYIYIHMLPPQVYHFIGGLCWPEDKCRYKSWKLIREGNWILVPRDKLMLAMWQ